MSERITHHGVVVGADGSPSSRVAVRWAAREATMRHVPLTVVHVAASLRAASTLAWPAGRVPEEVLEIQENETRRVIADAIKVVEDSAAGGDRPEINSELLVGGPVPTLVDLSKEAQMVVVGCRGRTGRRRGLLGSVSTGLIHHAHCPVAVIHDEVRPRCNRRSCRCWWGSTARGPRSWRRRSRSTKPHGEVWIWWRCTSGATRTCPPSSAWNRRSCKPRPTRRLPKAWPAGRSVIPRSRSTAWSNLSSPAVIFLTSLSGLRSSS